MSLPKAVGSSDVWQRTAKTLIDAAKEREWTAIIGEPGTGKTALARAVSEHVAADQEVAVINSYPDCMGSLVEEVWQALEDGRDVLVREWTSFPPRC